MGECINCHGPLPAFCDPDLDSFCCDTCKQDYYEALRDVAEHDHYDPPQEVESVEEPWWHTEK